MIVVNIYKKNKISFFVALLVLILLFFVLYKKNHSVEINANTVAQVPTLSPLSIFNAKDHYRWKNNSHYTVVVYFSMDCVHCRKLTLFLEDLADQFSDKFNLVYRHHPLDSQPLSAEKALVAECVYKDSGDVVMFNFIHEVYSDYRLIQSNNDWVVSLAKKYVGNTDDFDACINNAAVKDALSIDTALGTLDGVKGVPTIGIFYDNKLVGRYDMINGSRAIEIIIYLSKFVAYDDQFWSNNILNKI